MKTLYIIELDLNPAPWEDYSSPYCVFHGTKEEVRVLAKSIKRKNKGALVFYNEIALKDRIFSEKGTIYLTDSVSYRMVRT